MKTMENFRKKGQIRGIVKIHIAADTAQKIRFTINDFFGKCDQIRSFLHFFVSVGMELITKGMKATKNSFNRTNYYLFH